MTQVTWVILVKFALLTQLTWVTSRDPLGTLSKAPGWSLGAQNCKHPTLISFPPKY